MNNQEQPTMVNCAMNFGAVVGMYYIVKFCLFPLGLHSVMASLLFWGLTVVVPFFVFLLVILIFNIYLFLAEEFRKESGKGATKKKMYLFKMS